MTHEDIVILFHVTARYISGSGWVDFPQFLAMMSQTYKEADDDDEGLREAFKVNYKGGFEWRNWGEKDGWGNRGETEEPHLVYVKEINIKVKL